MNTVDIIFKGNKGVMMLDNNKPIFNHIDNENTDIGIGVILKGTYVDKGTYAFADMRNKRGVLPKGYYTSDFHINSGVPLKMELGQYGDTIFVKETFCDNVFLKTFSTQGDILVKESKYRQNNKDNLNLKYCKLDNEIANWQDITDEVHIAILEDIKAKSTTLDLSNIYLLYVVKGIIKNKVYIKDNIVYAQGKHTTMVIWGEEHKAKILWLGVKINTLGFEDITNILEASLKNA
ncbi:hypothetical protein D3C81_09260 [compost metagenome]